MNKIEKELTKLFRRMLINDDKEQRLAALKKMNRILEENNLSINDIEVVNEKGKQL